jgi:BirA family biotin operon repressor/biotin-[acetyl-CoA-carboxylase] ligase
MTSLDRDAIHARLGEITAGRLERMEAFEEIESTNSYLMAQEAPSPGLIRIALTDNQVAGRGRHGRVWQSPPGSGIALSAGYTFAEQPADLAALTLAAGLGVVGALGSIGIPGVQLKWPNDLIADNGKLGGILTETRPLPGGAIMVVTGLGLNLRLDQQVVSELASEGARPVVDLAGFAGELPCRNELTARLIEGLCATFLEFEVSGFSCYLERWAEIDWLRGRSLEVETPASRLRGTGAGIGADGALLVVTESGEVSRITSGTIVMAGEPEGAA